MNHRAIIADHFIIEYIFSTTIITEKHSDFQSVFYSTLGFILFFFKCILFPSSFITDISPKTIPA